MGTLRNGRCSDKGGLSADLHARASMRQIKIYTQSQILLLVYSTLGPGFTSSSIFC